ncbi:hypothetical protein ARMA_0382 [Ardenticatena maritima]|uniref:Uncharacterized protein n=1 Tax=Ardenticatena maritima TaxID=872965 RepID=A0A0M8K7B8_9CHLR|nr:hypothetical protein ARMA_0382 [Ardenticatena maritima]
MADVMHGSTFGRVEKLIWRAVWRSLQLSSKLKRSQVKGV